MVYLILVGNICGNGDGILFQRSQFFGDVIYLLQGPGGQDNLCSLLAEGEGYGTAQPSPAPGDNGDSTFAASWLLQSENDFNLIY